MIPLPPSLATKRGCLFMRQYVLDANVLIEAHRRYYAFDLCPGFWECLLHHHDNTRLVSIDHVREELVQGKDELEDWVKNHANNMFANSDAESVVKCYSKLINWINNQTQFKKAAIDDFANGADGWVIAYAKANNGVVVTHEEYSRNAKKKVPIPNVCDVFNVDYVNTFEMLKNFGTVFSWSPSA